MASYSFRDCKITISGVGGTAIFGGLPGGVDKGGITIEADGDKNRKTVGADGAVVHSLIVDDSGKITIRTLKTAMQNVILNAMLQAQKQSAAVWGRNVITLLDIARGDSYTCIDCAFSKVPSNEWKDEAGTIEWTFDAGKIIQIMGTGLPSAV